MKYSHLLASAVLVSSFLPAIGYADGSDGNRYSDELTREYHSEISASEAYVATLIHQDHKHARHNNQAHPIIIDVRTIEEYVGGHPPNAYSIPFPHIYNRQHDPAKGEYIGQDPEDFVAAVNALDLPKDTLIITMCRTGYRSVLAGNLLAEEGYTNVRNMWEGFKGRLKQNLAGEYVDLDGDGEVNSSDPYSGDLDGWANFAGLPVSFKLKPNRLYSEYMSMYYNVTGER